MQNGWVKLHQKIIFNEVWRNDPTAWRVFEYLLVKAYSGKPQGTVTTTRQQIADGCLINNNTAWSAFLRLKKAKMVNSSTNRRYTTVRICNWHSYQTNGQQAQQQLNNNSTTTQQHSYKNKKEIKNKNIVETQSVYDLYLKVFNKNENSYKLTDKRKAKIAQRLKDAGSDLLAAAITNTGASAFHRGDNDRGWSADLDFIIRSYEQVEKLATVGVNGKKELTIKDINQDEMEYLI